MSLQFNQVSFSYKASLRESIPALNQVNLEIGGHEFVGLIGRTGSGKSTLAQHMNGLFLPDQGEVFVDGINTKAGGEAVRKIRQKVGLVFQYPEDQLFEETVFKDIAFGPQNMGLEGEELEDRVQEAMAWVGLPFASYKDRSPFELSGGEQRRVAIAGVLALRPDYLVLDEPAAGLDPRGRREVMGQVQALFEESPQMNVILVTHSMDDIADLADRVLVLDQGKLVLDESPGDLFSHPDLLAGLGLDIPDVSRAVQTLYQEGYELDPKACRLEQALASLKPLISGGRIQKKRGRDPDRRFDQAGAKEKSVVGRKEVDHGEEA